MSLLEKENRKKLFSSPISTKERDDMPTLYGPESATKNSLVADGCIIDGQVENCIIFKGVKVETVNGAIEISVYICLKADAKVKKTAERVQENIKDKIQTMTGNAVTKVNVQVADIEIKDEE